jgi:formylglycine-generating enzyme required for sulfatase activity
LLLSVVNHSYRIHLDADAGDWQAAEGFIKWSENGPSELEIPPEPQVHKWQEAASWIAACGASSRYAGADVTRDMNWISGGSFLMGSNCHYPEEAPQHRVCVEGFFIDRYPVTNHQFAAFADTTNYVTVAERPLNPAEYPGALAEMLAPGSLVFHRTEGPVDLRDIRNWWTWTPGASWRHPEGRGSTITGRMDHPVVQVAFEDAEAYARWAGKELPSEAEWEFAARGGLDGAEFVWGNELAPGGRQMANMWQGEFPWQNLCADGFEGTSPVGAFPPNGYGLYDMAGNVWQWTMDWFSARHPASGANPCCIPENPRGASVHDSYDPAQPQTRIPRKVVKGGSFLCAANYCWRYRPAARHAQMIDSGMSHIGFRCIARTGRRP